MRNRAVPVVLAATMLATVSLQGAAEPKLSADPDLAKSDAALLQDEAKATAEFQRRLRAQVGARNGLLIVHDSSGAAAGVTVMPATMPWGVDCGDGGIALTFGTGSGDTDNGVVLQLTNAAVADSKCTAIAPAIGEAVLAIIQGN